MSDLNKYELSVLREIRQGLGRWPRDARWNAYQFVHSNKSRMRIRQNATFEIKGLYRDNDDGKPTLFLNEDDFNFSKASRPSGTP